MRKSRNMYRICVALALILVLGGCAAYPAGPYYRVSHNYTENDGPISLGPGDQNYVLDVDDRTPFEIHALPKTDDLLYSKGYDRVRRQKNADFSIEVLLSGGVQDNPEVRAGNTLGGAVAGAAMGALIGAAAAGEPAMGAAIGGAGGATLGLLAPAETGLIRIDLTIHSYNEGTTSQKSATIDLTPVPPHDLHYVVDNEISRMLRSIPHR
jgi:hypothetical protein